MKRLILIFALILVLLGFSIYGVGGISESEKYSGRDAGGIQSNSGELCSKEFLSSYELEDYPGTYDLVPEKYNLSVDSKLVGNLRANTYATRGNTYATRGNTYVTRGNTYATS